jgi:hypothetical protein
LHSIHSQCTDCVGHFGVYGRRSHVAKKAVERQENGLASLMPHCNPENLKFYQSIGARLQWAILRKSA